MIDKEIIIREMMKHYDFNRVHEDYKDILISEGMIEVFEHFGYKCAIIRHMSLLHWCGYVYVDCYQNMTSSDLDELFDVHGGITWVGERYGEQCIGFDCAHAYDLIPYKGSSRFGDKDLEYRTRKFAEREVTKLAKQVYEDQKGFYYLKDK